MQRSAQVVAVCRGSCDCFRLALSESGVARSARASIAAGGRMKRLLTWLTGLATCLLVTSAEAQPSRGDFRFSIDLEVLGIEGVHAELEDTNQETETTIFTVGNAVTPAYLGVGWALSPKTLLGTRIGFGFRKDSDSEAKATTFSIAPHLTFLPMGNDTKLFIEVGPILRLGHQEAGRREVTGVAGGGGIALGAIIFTSRGASLDVGFFFDATWGEVTSELWFLDADVDARILRGGVRLGLSLWE